MAVEYELERDRNIAKNKRRMRELGVGTVETLERVIEKKRPAGKSKLEAEDPPRRSGRVRTTVQSYSDEYTSKAELAASGAAKAARAAYAPKPTPDLRRRSALSLPDHRGDIPRHPKKRHLIFKDRPDFKPNLTPAQVIAAGSFGGCYFNPRGGKPGIRGPCAIDPAEFPKAWFDSVDPINYQSRRYNIKTNLYGVKAGQDQRYWEERGWIDARDPRGWFHWYCRFFAGRRLDDGEDERQISRWKGVCGDKGRWKRNLINKIVDNNASWDDSSVSPVRIGLVHDRPITRACADSHSCFSLTHLPGGAPNFVALGVRSDGRRPPTLEVTERDQAFYATIFLSKWA